MLEQYAIAGRRASEIAASIEQAVTAGSLPPGASLPAIRELADLLTVNPNTVAAAYRTLRERGVVETAGRRGTRVRARPATSVRSAGPLPVPPGARDLSTGNPNPDLLPPLRPALAQVGTRHVLYGEPAASDDLVALARNRLRADGVPADAVAISSGALDGIERVLAAHLRPGDRVAVEDPGWANVIDLVAALGLVCEPVRVDDDGLLPSDVEMAIRRGARAVLATVRAHNPQGAATGARRAEELRALLDSAADVLVVEDDHAAEVAGVPLHTVTGRTEHWAYVRSVAKTYGPDLRLAVLAADPVTIDRVQGRLRLRQGWVSHLLQDTVAALWRDPATDALVHTASGFYAARRRGLCDALAERGVRAHGRSGLNVWVPVPDETAATTRLQSAGFVVVPGAQFRLSSGPGIRLTIAELDLDEIEPLADAVAAAVRPVRQAVSATT